MLLVLAFFFSDAVDVLFKLFPTAVLGVILFLTGAQLALGSSSFPAERSGRVVVLLTAALCMWNVGVGFVIGIALHHLQQGGRLRM
ncbi:hypothetical protein D3C79_1075490 [compost metagenome]